MPRTPPCPPSPRSACIPTSSRREWALAGSPRESRVRRDGVSRRARRPLREDRGHPPRRRHGSRRDRHGHRPRSVSLRGLRKVFDEIVAVKEACGPAHLKVILETGELERTTTCARRPTSRWPRAPTSSRRPPVRSSRGDSRRGARDARSDPRPLPRDRRRVGMKPAGGIRTSKQALHLLVHRQGDARRRVADARPVPHRRVDARSTTS